MKKISFSLTILLLVVNLQAQKIDYKDGIIKVDGKDLAKMNKIKDKGSFGLTSTFEIYSMSGEKLVIGVYARGLEERQGDPNYHYRLTFLPVDQTGIFSVSKMSPEKSFAQLIGKSGIIVNDKLDAEKVKEFIATTGASVEVKVDYTIVSRDRRWPLSLKQGNSIEQDNKTIGSFKDVTVPDRGVDIYEFSLPTGVVVASVSFSGGNNAQQCQLHTMKDNNDRLVGIPSKDHVTNSSGTYDRNDIVLMRIIKWLVANQYL